MDKASSFDGCPACVAGSPEPLEPPKVRKSMGPFAAITSTMTQKTSPSQGGLNSVWDGGKAVQNSPFAFSFQMFTRAISVCGGKHVVLTSKLGSGVTKREFESRL